MIYTIYNIILFGLYIISNKQSIYGHVFIVEPKPSYLKGTQFVLNAPTAYRNPNEVFYGYPRPNSNTVEWFVMDPKYNQDQFNTQWDAFYQNVYINLRGLTKYGSKEKTLYVLKESTKCGYTIENSDRINLIRQKKSFLFHVFGLRHIGPCELWVDNTRVFFLYNCNNKNTKIISSFDPTFKWNLTIPGTEPSYDLNITFNLNQFTPQNTDGVYNFQFIYVGMDQVLWQHYRSCTRVKYIENSTKKDAKTFQITFPTLDPLKEKTINYLPVGFYNNIKKYSLKSIADSFDIDLLNKDDKTIRNEIKLEWIDGKINDGWKWGKYPAFYVKVKGLTKYFSCYFSINWEITSYDDCYSKSQPTGNTNESRIPVSATYFTNQNIKSDLYLVFIDKKDQISKYYRSKSYVKIIGKKEKK